MNEGYVARPYCWPRGYERHCRVQPLQPHYRKASRSHYAASSKRNHLTPRREFFFHDKVEITTLDISSSFSRLARAPARACNQTLLSIGATGKPRLDMKLARDCPPRSTSIENRIFFTRTRLKAAGLVMDSPGSAESEDRD